MLTAILGLSTAVFFGGADFLGGVASRRISPVRVTALSALGGLVIFCVVVPLFGGVWSAAAIGWGALAGIVACVSVSMLYAALAIGPMSILAPLISVVSAIVPMLTGLLGGERFAAAGYAGLGIALLAVILVGFSPQRIGSVRPTARGILLAVGAGTSMGAGLVIFTQMPADSGFVPLVVQRTVTVAVMFAAVGVIALRQRHGRLPASLRRGSFPTATIEVAPSGWRAGFGIALGAGVFAGIADAFMLAGVRTGDLSVMAVLVAMNSATTALLATIVLHERLTRPQLLGLACAVVAVALLALG
ncbi:MAG: hypothetical protein JWQ43_91 [Glaciihabitans sp.]|nr:hypothetical protein [Glaciihabitans sp.]